MAGEEIRINFWPLKKQDIEFVVWRKKYGGERKEGVYSDLYKSSLPVAVDNKEVREDYWVSFNERQGFEKFSCKGEYNNFLTKDFLFYAVVEKTKKVLDERQFMLPKAGFRKYMYYVLEEHNEGWEVVWLEPYLLKVSKEFGFLLDFRFRKKEGVAFSSKVQQLSLSLDRDFRSNRNFYIDKFGKVSAFGEEYYKRIFPININECVIDVSSELKALNRELLDIKKYVFGGQKVESSQFMGVKEHGPLTSLKSDVKAVYICRDRDKMWVNDLIEGLRGESFDVNFDGFKDIFKVDIKDDSLILPNYSEDNIDSAVNELVKIKSALGDRPVLPIIILDTLDESYFEFKYRFLKEGLPLQAVTVDLLKKRGGLKWAASNIALQIFAKLGGQPWKVKPSNDDCIIFGIGQSHQEVDRKIVKYFAYSVNTDSSGLYKKISTLGKSERENEYLEQLRDNIIKDVNDYLEEGYKKCALHIPFKIRWKELEVISRALKEVGERKTGEDVDFVVLKVNTKNHFFGYANTNSLVPYESSYIRLSDKEFLVWFEGMQLHRESIFKRYGGPIHLEFYWANRVLNEEDKRSYLQDVLNLSGANWRGFNAKNIPVSIYYCELVAEFLSRFPKEIDNIEKISNAWFL